MRTRRHSHINWQTSLGDGAIQTQMFDLGVGQEDQDLTEALHIKLWKIK